MKKQSIRAKRVGRYKKKIANRVYTLRRKYNITIADYDALVIIQDNKCAMCGKRYKKKYYHIDHDHRTGKVRGLLCQHCNLSLGQFGDSIIVLQRAIDYLSSPPASKIPKI